MNFLLGVMVGTLPFLGWSCWRFYWKEVSAGWGKYWECYWCHKVFVEDYGAAKHWCAIRALDYVTAAIYVAIRHPVLLSKAVWRDLKKKLST